MGRWIVTISPGSSVDKIVSELTARGFSIEHVFEVIGSIVGNADPGQIDALRAVAGVDAVEPDTPVDVGPPDSDLS